MTSPIPQQPSPSTQLIAIRHGETSWNRTARYQGQENIALNEAGFSQVTTLHARFVGHADALYTSDLKRAYQFRSGADLASGLFALNYASNISASFRALPALKLHSVGPMPVPSGTNAWLTLDRKAEKRAKRSASAV